MSIYTVNELLCFLSTQFDKLDRTNINSVLVDFYKRDEIIKAKDILISECQKVNVSDQISESKKSRHKPNVEQKHIKDILDIWTVIDNEIGGNLNTKFVASNPNRNPSVNADRYNLKYLISSILNL